MPFMMFNDDIKLFVQVKSQQEQLCRVSWVVFLSVAHDMRVNPTNTKLVTYSKLLNVLVGDYLLDGACMERCDSIRGLGILINWVW